MCKICKGNQLYDRNLNFWWLAQYNTEVEIEYYIKHKTLQINVTAIKINLKIKKEKDFLKEHMQGNPDVT